MSQSQPATILFVDDDPAHRRTLGWLFRNADYQVLEAATGEEALRLAEQKPDLVVLDVNLPDINGFEVCRRLKAHAGTSSIPVLHLSAVFVESGDRAQGLEGGADGYLIKPVEPRELLATARALMRVRAAEEVARAVAQQWRTTFDAISDAVCLLDAGGRVCRCNRALSELLGRPADELLGRPYAEALREGLGLAEDPPVAAPGGEPRELLLGGRWFRASADPIPGPRGACAGSVHILTDVTRRKEMEEDLRQAQKMEAIGKLAAGVAHDFNNLLTAVLGNASLLQRTLPRDGPESDLVRGIERASWRAAELTRQLLGFSRQTLLWLKSVDPTEVVAEVLGVLRRTADRRVRLQARSDEGLWAVQADPVQLTQVLLNLCLNSLDAMPAGGQLTLDAANRAVSEEDARGNREARAGSFVRLSVIDTGVGIPAEVQPQIFDPFFTTKPPGKGVGLGLAMVYGVVKQHQGWVECHSAPGRGARFEVYLPRGPAGQPQPGPTLAAGAGGAETVLLVDPNDLLRGLAAAFLRQNGFQVLVAAGERQAAEVFEREHDRVDLVVLEEGLARQAGAEVLARLRARKPGVLALVAGSPADAASVVPYDLPGVLGFIAKPYCERELVQAVRAALDSVRPSEKLPAGPP
jgi:signal transduction histidine kinase